MLELRPNGDPPGLWLMGPALIVVQSRALGHPVNGAVVARHLPLINDMRRDRMRHILSKRIYCKQTDVILIAHTEIID